MKPHTRDLGKGGEERAARYLVEKGYRLLERNYTLRHGEIDIIANDPAGTLVFVEVKTALTRAAGDPGYWVDKRKQAQVGRMAAAYLALRGITDHACRFDVVTLQLDSGEAPEIRHYEDAFRLSYSIGCG
ncbi:MAG: YraN family protein [Fibrobacterota bacterium]